MTEYEDEYCFDHVSISMGQRGFGCPVHAPESERQQLKPTVDRYWDTPTEPLSAPMAHQFRYRDSGQEWEADFQRMILSSVRLDGFLLSEEPMLFDLQQGPAGELRMRLTEDSRRTMIANIEARLATSGQSLDAGSDRRDRAKLARVAQGVWLPIPPGIADAMSQRYTAFLREQ